MFFLSTSVLIIYWNLVLTSSDDMNTTWTFHSRTSKNDSVSLGSVLSDWHLSSAWSWQLFLFLFSSFLLSQAQSLILPKSSCLPQIQTQFSIWVNMISEVIEIKVKTRSDFALFLLLLYQHLRPLPPRPLFVFHPFSLSLSIPRSFLLLGAYKISWSLQVF